ncbi:uncharacterized protein LOC131857372 [Cryptomeria japonica]|uniref:uncharacterized protein LOC131857372 n=1 Tax=Cryptomeria japonica TaxID=3369 RepID=UPI0027DA18FF|nr:uncharacterized protein LOC131857372 [Cryptomeria japonica]
MKGIWEGLSIPPFIGDGPEANLRKRVACKWHPPGKGWLKLNFDGASRGNPRVVGIGCSIHNWEGKEIFLRAHPIGIKTNNWVELVTLLEGLNLCKKMGVKNLDIEGDSTITINALRKGSIPNWRLNSLLTWAIELCKGYERFMINHIYREGNKRAHELANLGADDIHLP